MKKLLAVIKLADKLGFDLSQLTFSELVELSIEIKKCFKNAVDKPSRKLYKMYTVNEDSTVFLNESYLTEEQAIAVAKNPHIHIYES